MDGEIPTSLRPKNAPWNKGRIMGQKRPLKHGSRSEQHLQRDFHTVSGSVGAAPARRARCGDLAPPLRNRWFESGPLQRRVQRNHPLEGDKEPDHGIQKAQDYRDLSECHATKLMGRP